MGEDNGIGWPSCADGCSGIRLASGDKCLAHADAPDLEAELKRFGTDGIIDARGVAISAELLDRILVAAPRKRQDPRPRFTKAQFEGATFGEKVSFEGAVFGDGADFRYAEFGIEASFYGARFGDEAWFHGATFGDKVSFEGATFGAGARFRDVTFGDTARFRDVMFGEKVSFEGTAFGGEAWFHGATFGDGAGFQGVTFGDRANFGDATFGARAGFGGATFGDAAWFGGATFGNAAWFGRSNFGFGAKFDGATFGHAAGFTDATFGDEAWFRVATFGVEARFAGATFGDRASFESATIGRWATFGPLLIRGRLILERAAFGQDSTLAISADRLDCHGLRLPDGLVMNLRWAEVWLDGVDFGRPSVLAGVGPFSELDERVLGPTASRSWCTARPRVLSLRGSDVRNLVLSNVDLRACRFSGAHNLDQLRLEATIDLADRPTGWRLGWALPPLWRWTRRRTLAEEHRWRRAHAKHAGWYPRACRVRGMAGEERALRPVDIAMLYRALRKGREDSKDEPGAADFYYGEMEMRRHDRTAPWAERVVLWLYWLVAGYGLRASRALGWLLGVLAAATVLLAAAGFPPPPLTAPLTATVTGIPAQQHIQLVPAQPPAMTAARPLAARLGTAALVAVEGAVFRTSDQALTYKGRLVQTMLRLVGPVMLGLGLLSIRGRVKR